MLDYLFGSDAFGFRPVVDQDAMTKNRSGESLNILYGDVGVA